MRPVAILMASFMVTAVVTGCRQSGAEVPCPPQDDMPLIAPDSSRYPMPRVTPAPHADSAMVVTPPCPDTAR